MKRPVSYRMFDYDYRLVPNAVVAEMERGTRNLDDAKKTSGHSVGWPGWALLYSLALCQFAPGRSGCVIETGTNLGSSTLILAQALRDRGVLGPRLFSFEIDAERASTARARMSDAGFSDIVEVVHSSSTVDLGKHLESRVDRAGCRLAFLDASHLEADVAVEFESILPFMAPDGLVIFDNTYRIASPGEDGRVNEFLRGLVTSHFGNVINLPYASWFTPGIAVWQLQPDLDLEHEPGPQAGQSL